MMMLNRLELESRIRSLLADYDFALENREPESAVDAHLFAIEELSPNSDFTDMMFYGERERDFDELASEAARREEIFLAIGRAGVLEHIRQQMVAALSDRNLRPLGRRHAEMKIAEIDAAMPAGHA